MSKRRQQPTPGPWSTESTVHGWRVWGQDRSRGAEPGDMVAVADEMTEADARLCAAAHELLAALEHVAHVLHAPHFAYLSECSDPSCKQAWAALTKARGESVT